jgi:hypothetical protein
VLTLAWLEAVFFSKGYSFYNRPKSLLLAVEPVLFINFNICGRFWGKIGEFGTSPGQKNRGGGEGFMVSTSVSFLAQIKKYVGHSYSKVSL